MTAYACQNLVRANVEIDMPKLGRKGNPVHEPLHCMFTVPTQEKNVFDLLIVYKIIYIYKIDVAYKAPKRLDRFEIF